MQAIYKAPWVGLLGLVIGFQSQPLGHAAYTLMASVGGSAVYVFAVIVGIVGLLLVWQGLKRPELPATLFGLVGGWLIWIGWFEFSFEFFAQLYRVAPYAVEPSVPNGYMAAPQANMLQATVTIMLALFLLYGMFNLQTKCNLMRWFHRNLHFSPGMPTPDNKRSFARITAMEMLFVTWFCYLFWLYACYLGTRGSGAYIITTVYAAWTIWALYLIYRCTKQVRMAAALRYGIGAGIVLWCSVEMPAHFGAYHEYWLHPFDYPLFNVVSALLFFGGIAISANRPTRSVSSDG